MHTATITSFVSVVFMLVVGFWELQTELVKVVTRVNNIRGLRVCAYTTLGLCHAVLRRAQGEANSGQQVALFHRLLNAYRLGSFFPAAAVADILGDGDEGALGLVA